MTKNKKDLQTETQIFYLLSQIVELFPQYTFSQHLSHILRTKGHRPDIYDWSDLTLLKVVEQYYDELQNELVNQ
ncbi:hypothetical protein [Leptolyngbya phage Lbo-JY46]